MSTDVLVVLPTYNEAANLERIVGELRDRGVAVLVVDDASPDGTGRIADRLADADAAVHVLHRPAKEGLGPAYAAGFAAAARLGAGIVCEMDADHSHDPAELTRLIAAMRRGADLAIGSRYVPGGRIEGWPLHRRLLSRLGNRYAALMLGSRVRDLTSGFRAYRADVLDTLRPDSCRASGYGFQVEMAWRAERAGCDVREVPITFRDRTAGASKMTTRIALEAVRLVTGWGLLRLFGRLPSPDMEKQ